MENSKLEKLLGMGEDSAVPVSLKKSVQHAGYLDIKKGDSSNPLNSFKRRYFVVKDGFLLQYNSEDNWGFDQPPLSVFPLNGAYSGFLNTGKKARPSATFEILHPDIFRAHFLLRAEDRVGAQDWLDCLDNAKKANWENAKLGVAVLDSMKAKGTKLEKEKTEAAELLKERANRLAKIQKDKINILERERKQKENFEENVDIVDHLLAEKEHEKEKIEQDIVDREIEFKKNQVKRVEIESKLGMATMALNRLEAALESEFKPAKKFADEVDVTANAEKRTKAVAKLRSFFEQTAEAHKKQQVRYNGGSN
mmetsp:Transcript_5504/g.6962  ORF Transcript_5504/g.6962 Transcript_5504/m.6962 type:complete len:309 (+) Transcript_5504:161-1087(+)|eukprot:CAMPEP_0204840652 /NCGR_PEP_ID=MMETSP1346-20131115/38331_1 /ASSEMBLY_ACC=CAM_ASM_000771 /TAXON_ID=215587 /ORGANISM="Aplanochytrium stocchinoi, Strain GSBS06" /LENGTH=308 /DNA_ID=CAMNT_0051978177 /DNA_START=29 /DNA_END=955 /DNA_ORIENTATION=-